MASWTGRAEGGTVARRIRHVVAATGLPILLVAFLTGSYVGLIQYSGNVHTVEAGRLYRSAQLDKADLARVITEDGIKSILNLRGANPRQAWYEDEVATATMLGVAHYDYGLSARRIVAPSQIAEIMEIIRTAPKPMLIHCKAGADRTGLVAALYRLEVEGVGADEADAQLSLLYGHFPYLGSKTRAMDESFRAVANR